MSRRDCHIAPEKAAIERNKILEPLGEQARADLIDWINRYGIVSAMLDTDEHCVSIEIVKLPPEIKPVLTEWGSIYVRNDGRVAPAEATNPMRTVLKHLKEWDERYPRGKYCIVEYGTQQKSEEELDAICDEARKALAIPAAQPAEPRTQPTSIAESEAKKDRDALMDALGWKITAKVDELILSDARLLRPEMVKARRRAQELEGDAMLAQYFVSENPKEFAVKLFNLYKAQRERADKAEAAAPRTQRRYRFREVWDLAKQYSDKSAGDISVLARAVISFLSQPQPAPRPPVEEVARELAEAIQSIEPYLSTQTELLDHAASNEDGRASGYDVASAKCRKALSAFFTAIPAAPLDLTKPVYVNNPQFKGYGIAVYDTGHRKRMIGVRLENGNVWEYDAETVRNALPDEYHKMPRAIQPPVETAPDPTTTEGAQ